MTVIFIYYALPLLIFGAVLLGVMYMSYKYKGCFPSFYAAMLKLYEALPKIGAVIVILGFIWYYLGGFD